MASGDELWPLAEGGAETSSDLVGWVGFSAPPGPKVKPAMAESVGCTFGTHGPVGIRIVLTIPAAMAAGKARAAYRALQAIAPLKSQVTFPLGNWKWHVTPMQGMGSATMECSCFLTRFESQK